MVKRIFFNNEKGALLLEVLAAVGIGVVVVAAIAQLGIRALRESVVSNKSAQTTRYTEQGIEAVRSIRDQDLKDAFTDNTCGIVANVTDPKAPPQDPASGLYVCNEWSDVYRDSVSYTIPKTFKLIPPLSDPTKNYWRLVASPTPEDINSGVFKRSVTLSELVTADPNRIKKIVVESWTMDGVNTLKSTQETYLRKL